MNLSVDSDMNEIIILVPTIERRKRNAFKKDLILTIETENLASLVTLIKDTKSQDEI